MIQWVVVGLVPLDYTFPSHIGLNNEGSFARKTVVLLKFAVLLNRFVFQNILSIYIKKEQADWACFRSLFPFYPYVRVLDRNNIFGKKKIMNLGLV